jgi:tetratricopeptide (TPR) repeat protein
MSSQPYQPRRLRDSNVRPGSIGWKLARQLQLLAAHPDVPQLGPAMQGKNRGGRLLMAVRVTVVALILFALAGAASASAVLLIRNIRSAEPPPAQSPAAAPAAAGRLRPRRPAPTAIPAATSPAAPALLGTLPPTAPSTTAPSRPAPSASENPEARPRVLLASGTGKVAARPLASRAAALRPSALPASAPAARQDAATAEAPNEAALAPPPATLAPMVEPHLPSTSPPRRPLAETVVPATGIADEAALLRQALVALRQAKDAKRALELLELYGERYPRGSLMPEASAARAQALLRLGDQAAALRILDELPLDRGNQAIELRLARGELRSLAGRCPEALRDFEEILERATRAPDRARALYGRASCRARLGDSTGAAEDRRRYLEDFPDGPAAPSLRARP